MRSLLSVNLELAIVLVAFWQGEGDYVAAGVIDVDAVTVGGEHLEHLDTVAVVIGDVDLDHSEVLGEDHRQPVAIKGGLDGRAPVRAAVA